MEEENKELTPELREKLRGFMAFGENPEFWYVPKIYREKNDKGEFVIPKDLWPTFKLRGKTGIEIADEEDNAGYLDPDTRKVHLTTGKRRLSVLAKNILDWKNFRDEDGNAVACKRVGGEVYKLALKRLPAALQTELHEAINEQTKLSEDELLGLEL